MRARRRLPLRRLRLRRRAADVLIELQRFGLQSRQFRREERDDLGIEPLAGFLLQQVDRGIGRHGLVVRPLRHQRVEVVDDRENARAQWDFLALESAPDSAFPSTARGGSG